MLAADAARWLMTPHNPQARRARVRAVFAKHNVIDEYDYWSDISR